MSIPYIELAKFSERPKHEQDKIILRYSDIEVEQNAHAGTVLEWLKWFGVVLFAATMAATFIMWLVVKHQANNP